GVPTYSHHGRLRRIKGLRPVVHRGAVGGDQGKRRPSDGSLSRPHRNPVLRDRQPDQTVPNPWPPVARIRRRVRPTEVDTARAPTAIPGPANRLIASGYRVTPRALMPFVAERYARAG